MAALAVTTRREFARMLLGGALAGVAGCRSDRRRTIDGDLVDTGQARGHARVRDAGVPTPAEWRHHRVVIVGGGVAGLAAAWELRRRRVDDVVVLELDDIAGGTARGGSSAVTPYPWGAHYIVAPTREQRDLTDLLRELGAIEDTTADGTPIVDEALRCREPEERVFYRGRWYEGLYLHAGESDDDRRQLAAFLAAVEAWSRWRDADGRPAFAIPVSSCSQTRELAALDRTSFAAWLDARQLTSERLRWLCDYACRDDYGLLAADTSAWAGLFYFASRTRGDAPRGHAGDARSVVTWPDGNFALVRHLRERARVELGVAVRRVDTDGAVIALAGDRAIGIRAEHVIVATPGFVADRLVAQAPTGFAPSIDFATDDRPATTADYGAWAVANVHLRARPAARRSEPAAWDNVIRDSPSLGYVSATHQRGRDHGATVWTWYYPFTGDARAARTQVAGAGQAEWAEVVLADLERPHREIRDLVERIDVAFWGHGMVRPRPGSIVSPARLARARPRGRVHFAHTDLSGVALFEEAFDHGLRAAREVAEALA